MRTLAQILAAALPGEHCCVRCGGAVPVTPAAIDFLSQLHAGGELEAVDEAGVRMLLLVGAIDAGCGVSSRIEAGTPRASCPRCATPAELARGAIMAGGLRVAPAPARRL